MMNRSGTDSPGKQSVFPIHRLPPEILSEVQMACLDNEVQKPNGNSLDVTQFPWTLAQVCSSWRVTALHTPRLWSHLTIRIDSEHQVPTKLIEVLQTYLQRSARAPLTIKFHGWLSNLPNICDDVLDILLEVSIRWQSVELQVRHAQLPRCNAARGKVPILRSLKIVAFDLHRSPLGLDCFAEAPNLTQVHILNNSFNGILLPWHQLTSFAGHCRKATDALDLFRRSPKLIDCDIWVPENDILGTVPLRVNCLRALRVKNAFRIFDKLSLPGLEELSISDITTSFDDPPDQPKLFTSVISMLERSGCTLRKLSLRALPLYDDELIQILQVTPNLVDLVLEGVINHRYLFLDRLTYRPDDDTPPLVPQLESLTLSTVGIAAVDNLVTFVSSRCWEESDDGMRPSVVAKLKRIHIRTGIYPIPSLLARLLPAVTNCGLKLLGGPF